MVENLQPAAGRSRDPSAPDCSGLM